jgi:hypothetical protein
MVHSAMVPRDLQRLRDDKYLGISANRFLAQLSELYPPARLPWDYWRYLNKDRGSEDPERVRVESDIDVGALEAWIALNWREQALPLEQLADLLEDTDHWPAVRAAFPDQDYRRLWRFVVGDDVESGVSAAYQVREDSLQAALARLLEIFPEEIVYRHHEDGGWSLKLDERLHDDEEGIVISLITSHVSEGDLDMADPTDH